MEKVSLYNKGKRDICFGEGFLLSGKTAEMSEAEANKLIALYSDEVVLASDFLGVKPQDNTAELLAKIEALEAEIKALKSEKESVFDAEKLKVSELKEILEKAGIEIPEGALKAELVALVKELDTQETE